MVKNPGGNGIPWLRVKKVFPTQKGGEELKTQTTQGKEGRTFLPVPNNLGRIKTKGTMFV